MILLLPGNARGDLGRAAESFPDVIGFLLTPRRPMWSYPQKLWAADNECYTLGDMFDFERYQRFLERAKVHAGQCLFVTVPDVVADADATAKRWRQYAPCLLRSGFPLAYVLQDGQECLPDGNYGAVFIGGSTEWKLGQTAARLAIEAKRRGLWVHMGRVNSIIRMRHAKRIGCDSVDGTGWAKSPTRHIRWALALLRSMQAQMEMELV